MSWIKRANQYGSYRRTYRGFRLYLRHHWNKLGTKRLIGVNNRGQIVEGEDIEEIGFDVDKVCLINDLDARDERRQKRGEKL